MSLPVGKITQLKEFIGIRKFVVTPPALHDMFIIFCLSLKYRYFLFSKAWYNDILVFL